MSIEIICSWDPESGFFFDFLRSRLDELGIFGSDVINVAEVGGTFFMFHSDIRLNQDDAKKMIREELKPNE